MTQIDWEELESIVRGMTSDEKARLLLLLGAEPKRTTPATSRLVGLFGDEPKLMDAVMDDVNFAREHHPLRLPPEA